MPFIFTDHKNQRVKVTVSPQELASLHYHDIFDYPLKINELNKWSVGSAINTNGLSTNKEGVKIKSSKGYLYLEGRENIVIKRLMRKNTSLYKKRIAEKAAKLIEKIPTVKAVLITGTLAMGNADERSDVDLMIITNKHSLWTTRFAVYGLLSFYSIQTRKPGVRDEKDKLCLNMWVDETSLSWSKKDRNIFTAHELSQVVPLVNKNNTYEKLIAKNAWIKNYWPNATTSNKVKTKTKDEKLLTTLMYVFTRIIEPMAKHLQLLYMRNKITNEEIGKTKAFFHPTKLADTIVGSFDSRIGN